MLHPGEPQPCSMDAVDQIWLFSLIPNGCSGVVCLEDQRKLFNWDLRAWAGEVKGSNAHAKGVKAEEGKGIPLHWTWCVEAFARASGPVQIQSAGGRWEPHRHSPWAGVPSSGTPVLPL